MKQHSHVLEAYTHGIANFNACRFWEAHEHWEACWRTVGEPDATFYKAIIQTAAALVHWQRGNPRGLWRNYYKARPKLLALPPSFHELDLQTLMNDMDQFVLHRFPSYPPRLRYAAALPITAQPLLQDGSGVEV